MMSFSTFRKLGLMGAMRFAQGEIKGSYKTTRLSSLPEILLPFTFLWAVLLALAVVFVLFLNGEGTFFMDNLVFCLGGADDADGVVPNLKVLQVEVEDV